ncbi:45 kDa calcium-binding protein-like [Lytechinus pictus]|uniref:45 kDa calcium-binding protein-like n=1 Tax=Lytechinus pictus TaxID=7653 RepID=UPI00240E0F59|nr:45 kDa calcium-binding protein-like [Lytechinus pictus]
MSFSITLKWPLPSLIVCAIILANMTLDCLALPAVLRDSGKLKMDGNKSGNEIDNQELNPELFPNNHIDAVKMERNGALNKEFQQELFWGPAHEEMNDVQEEEGRQRLNEIFKLADKDGDNYLTHDELTAWIEEKTAEHYSEAVSSSRQGFPSVDTNKDGFLQWDEYREQFFRYRGIDEMQLKAYREGKVSIGETLEEDYAMYRDRWDRADEDNDNALSIEEFLAFLHPEHCKSMVSMLVEEVLHDLNKNLDQALNLREFLALPDDEQYDVDKIAEKEEWVRERKKEFEENIDLDGDGIADFEELSKYMDPRNKQHAESEARHLMGVADSDGDGKLSAREVNNSYFVFLGSKVYNYARNVHDEF